MAQHHRRAPAPVAISNDVALEIARLGLIRQASAVGALQHAVDLATRTVTGCVGATVTRWIGPPPSHPEDPNPELDAMAATHPDVAELFDLQHAMREGPSYDTMRLSRPMTCDDTLIETRWPVFAAAALRRGVRCLATTLHTDEHLLVTMTLYGVQPDALTRAELPFASLLTAQGSAAVSNVVRFDDVHRTAVQLQEAAETRAVVGQACGVLMQALGCDADSAFKELRRTSQTRHIKLSALARRIVDNSNRANRGHD